MSRVNWKLAVLVATQLAILNVPIAYLAFATPGDLDLPVSPDSYRAPPPATVPVTPPEHPTRPPVDDPRDEPAPVFYGEELESENDTLVYVLDVSGSMTRGKLEAAQRETVRSIQQLPPSIRFNVVAFNCQITRWRPALSPADGPTKAAACAWVAALRAGGGTGTGPAVALALSDRQVRAVALLTDGAPGCGAYEQGQTRYEAHRRMIRNANAQGATINVFGIAASGDWRTFCQNVAGDSGGAYVDVTP